MILLPFLIKRTFKKGDLHYFSISLVNVMLGSKLFRYPYYVVDELTIKRINNFEQYSTLG